MGSEIPTGIKPLPWKRVRIQGVYIEAYEAKTRRGRYDVFQDGRLWIGQYERRGEREPVRFYLGDRYVNAMRAAEVRHSFGGGQTK